MQPRKAQRMKTQEYIFILWGDYFEEKAVAVFVTELRNIGLCVKVVGLAGQRSTGKYGLTLYADLTLGDALPLAHQAICVIAPCSLASMKRFENDPRIRELFQQANNHHAQFIISEIDVVEKSSLQQLAIPMDVITLYADQADLTLFARNTATALANLVANL